MDESNRLKNIAIAVWLLPIFVVSTATFIWGRNYDNGKNLENIEVSFDRIERKLIDTNEICERAHRLARRLTDRD